MRLLLTAAFTAAILLISPLNILASDRAGANDSGFRFRGYIGGMMLHTGYIFSKPFDILSPSGQSLGTMQIKGGATGIGGHVKFAFGTPSDMLRIGAEGHSSNVRYSPSHSYAHTGWGGIILDGRLYEGINYAAGELGHFVIALDGIPCNCGRRGCYEAYASATALIRQTKKAMEQNPDSLLWELAGGELDGVEGKTVFDGVRRNDPTAVGVLKQYIRYVGVGLVDLINVFQPELICIGGGISKAGDLLLEPLRAIIAEESYTRTAKRQTRLTVASLGNDAGIIGAALLPV